MIPDYIFSLLGSIASFLVMSFSWFGVIFQKKFSSLIRTFLFIGNFFFFLTLFLRWITEKYFPLSNLYESLIFLCWCISLISFFLEIKTGSRLITLILSPILFFLAAFSSLSLPIEMQKASPLVPSLQSNWLMMHVSMMMISYSFLIVGSLFSLLFLSLQFFSTSILFQKNFQNFFFQKTYLLESLDIWSYRVIGLGFPFLTIGIIAGAVWANEAWGSYWSWDPKETWALITWLFFASYLHARILKGWRGQKSALLAACGFFVLWVCYLGVNFLSKGLHSYGSLLT